MEVKLAVHFKQERINPKELSLTKQLKLWNDKILN